MKSLLNIKKTGIEIATILAQDDIVRKLLINDLPSALEDAVPQMDLNTLLRNHYISVFPPVENRIEEYDRNTFMSILVDNIGFQSGNARAMLRIYISTNEAHLLLANNRNRLLELGDRVLYLLDAQKLSTAGKIDITSMSHVMLSEFHAAYVINLSIADQVGGKAEV